MKKYLFAALLVFGTVPPAHSQTPGPQVDLRDSTTCTVVGNMQFCTTLHHDGTVTTCVRQVVDGQYWYYKR